MVPKRKKVDSALERPETRAEKRRREAEAASTSTQDPIDQEISRIEIPSQSLEAVHINIDEATSRIQRYTKVDDDDKTSGVFEELLKALPEEAGRKRLMADIISRPADEDLRALADELRKYLFRPLRSIGGKTPPGTPTPSSSSSSSSKPRSGQAKLKALCLRRDRNRCVMSGVYDSKLGKSLPEEERSQILRFAKTECAHIVPFSAAPLFTGGNVPPELNEKITNTWAFLYRYFPAVRTAINVRDSGAINSPGNALTLIAPLHDQFGSFEMAFEQVEGRENTYTLKLFPTFDNAWEFFITKGAEYTFASVDSIPPPDLQLLALHLAIANVLHATGMAEDVDDAFEDIEDLDCLAVDRGTTMEDTARWLLGVC